MFVSSREDFTDYAVKFADFVWLGNRSGETMLVEAGHDRVAVVAAGNDGFDLRVTVSQSCDSFVAAEVAGKTQVCNHEMIALA